MSDPKDIDSAAANLERAVMDELAGLVWDEVSCARVLMNLRDRLDRKADELLEGGTSYMDIMQILRTKR